MCNLPSCQPLFQLKTENNKPNNDEFFIKKAIIHKISGSITFDKASQCLFFKPDSSKDADYSIILRKNVLNLASAIDLAKTFI